MYLKSLTLKGFKSFADKTNLQFDPGLSVVVGPNGSGKSNVSDAVLWVLGEQSAKQLRGQSMEDVIFSGSKNRKEVGLAEVTLVLDNRDEVLPVDFKEVAITRRMYRTGESEYFINGAPARLMDVQDILHDSGLGKETHSIISQGKLDAVLSSKPKDRRELIEEAAGISKHRRRKERAQRKLAQMDANVVRAKDVMRELKRQLSPLAQQVDKAELAANIQTEAAELATLLAVGELRDLQTEWQGLQKRIQEIEAAQEIAQYRYSEKTQSLQKLSRILEEKGLFAGDIDEARSRVRTQIERLNSDVRLLEQKGQTMIERLSDMRLRMSSLEREKRSCTNTLEDIQARKSAVAQEIETLKAELNTLIPKQEAQLKKKQDCQNVLKALRKELEQARACAQREELKHARIVERQRANSERSAIFDQRLKGLQENLNASSRECEQTKAAQAKLHEKLKTLTQKLSTCEKAVEKARTEVESARHTSSVAQDELSKAQASFSALSSFLATEHEKDTEFLGSEGNSIAVLAQEAEFESGYEQAASAALSSVLRALSPSKGFSAAKLLTAANKKQAGAQILFSQENAPKLDEYTCLADVATNKINPYIASVLSHVYIVSNIAGAQKAHEKYPAYFFVTPDGELVDGLGVLHTKGASSAASLLSQQRQARQLKHKLPQLEAASAKARKTQENCEQTVAQALEQERATQAELTEAKGEQALHEREIGRLLAQISRTKAELENIQEAADKLAQELRAAKEKEQEAQALFKAATHKVETLSAQAEKEEAAQATILQEVEASLQATREIKLQLSELGERLRHFEQRIEELRAQQDEFETQLLATEKTSRALEVVRLRVDPLYELCEAVHAVMQDMAKKLQDQASLASTDSQEINATIAEAKQQQEAAQAELNAAQKRANETEVDRARLEVSVEHALDKVRQTTTVPIEEALELESDMEPQEMQERLVVLTHQLQEIGPVNQVALDEYEKLNERVLGLQEALDDMKAAKRAVNKVLTTIEKKMQQAFDETYEQVDKNFSELFALLFPGGNAHLVLEEAEDEKEPGIDIVAQPRGKRIPKLALLSGGEKSLCALALLFAVYKTRTVPFYIFDEVEAALDDANLHKFLDAIDTLKQQTQLIVISHQRATMEKADVLWGVTMAGDGVSTVLSQRLTQPTSTR